MRSVKKKRKKLKYSGLLTNVSGCLHPLNPSTPTNSGSPLPPAPTPPKEVPKDQASEKALSPAPSFLEDPSGFLQQQTAFLNQTLQATPDASEWKEKSRTPPPPALSPPSKTAADSSSTDPPTTSSSPALVPAPSTTSVTSSSLRTVRRQRASSGVGQTQEPTVHSTQSDSPDPESSLRIDEPSVWEVGEGVPVLSIPSPPTGVADSTSTSEEPGDIAISPKRASLPPSPAANSGDVSTTTKEVIEEVESEKAEEPEKPTEKDEIQEITEVPEPKVEEKVIEEVKKEQRPPPVQPRKPKKTKKANNSPPCSTQSRTTVPIAPAGLPFPSQPSAGTAPPPAQPPTFIMTSGGQLLPVGAIPQPAPLVYLQQPPLTQHSPPEDDSFRRKRKRKIAPPPIPTQQTVTIPSSPFIPGGGFVLMSSPTSTSSNPGKLVFPPTSTAGQFLFPQNGTILLGPSPFFNPVPTSGATTYLTPQSGNEPNPILSPNHDHATTFLRPATSGATAPVFLQPRFLAPSPGPQFLITPMISPPPNRILLSPPPSAPLVSPGRKRKQSASCLQGWFVVDELFYFLFESCLTVPSDSLVKVQENGKVVQIRFLLLLATDKAYYQDRMECG